MCEVLKKDREECIYCEDFFDCIGKPASVKRCINFEEGKNYNGRKKNVRKDNN